MLIKIIIPSVALFGLVQYSPKAKIPLLFLDLLVDKMFPPNPKSKQHTAETFVTALEQSVIWYQISAILRLTLLASNSVGLIHCLRNKNGFALIKSGVFCTQNVIFYAYHTKYLLDEIEYLPQFIKKVEKNELNLKFRKSADASVKNNSKSPNTNAKRKRTLQKQESQISVKSLLLFYFTNIFSALFFARAHPFVFVAGAGLRIAMGSLKGKKITWHEIMKQANSGQISSLKELAQKFVQADFPSRPSYARAKATARHPLWAKIFRLVAISFRLHELASLPIPALHGFMSFGAGLDMGNLIYTTGEAIVDSV